MSREIERRLKKIDRDLTADNLAEIAYDYFRDGKKITGVSGAGNFNGTPKLSGNARRNTKLSGDRILAQYPYAGRLDQGSSKQAPDGMSTPTTEYIKKYIDKYSKG
jgi:hypothetical protein